MNSLLNCSIAKGSVMPFPRDVKMLGRNQFALRQGFAFGKALYALCAPHPYGWVPIAGSYLTDQAVGINSLLNCSMAKGSVMPAM